MGSLNTVVLFCQIYILVASLYCKQFIQKKIFFCFNSPASDCEIECLPSTFQEELPFYRHSSQECVSIKLVGEYWPYEWTHRYVRHGENLLSSNRCVIACKCWMIFFLISVWVGRFKLQNKFGIGKTGKLVFINKIFTLSVQVENTSEY